MLPFLVLKEKDAARLRRSVRIVRGKVRGVLGIHGTPHWPAHQDGPLQLLPTCAFSPSGLWGLARLPNSLRASRPMSRDEGAGDKSNPSHTHTPPSPPPTRRTSYLPEPRRLCCLISLVGIGGLLLTSSCTFPLSLASAMLVPRPHPAHPSSWTTRDRMLSACPVPGPGARRWRGRKSQESVPPLEDADSA